MGAQTRGHRATLLIASRTLHVTRKAEAVYAFLASGGEGYIQTKYDEETGLANISRSSLDEVF